MSTSSSDNPNYCEIHSSFSAGTETHVRNLINAFESSKVERETRLSYLRDKPFSRLASVLILIFERKGHLRVVLTTRAKQLKSYGGETSLPGGKMDKDDDSVISTALREAYEEINLPVCSPHVHILGTLSFFPFHSLIVTPVVALLTDTTILDNLSPRAGEVDHIFSYPLDAILEPDIAPRYDTLVEQGHSYWPYESTYHHHIDYTMKALGGVTYRVHCYQTSASPITGMTSDILIEVAELAYRKQPCFERYAFDQLQTYEEIVSAYEFHQSRIKKSEDSVEFKTE